MYIHKPGIILIYFVNLFWYIICPSDKNYLYKYNQLYLSPRYSQKVEWKYVNLTSTFVCKDDYSDCSGNGRCLNTTYCECNSGYASLPGSYVKCSYKQKSKMIAILLEALGFGLGHLYTMNILMFVSKFMIFSFTCCNFCIHIFVGSANNTNVDEKTFKSTIRMFLIMGPVVIVWYVFDIIRYANGGYLDMNNMPLG
jgi:hypothetical protein